MTAWRYQVALFCADPDQGDALVIAATGGDINQAGTFMRGPVADGWYGAATQITEQLAAVLTQTPAEACLFFVWEWENGALTATNHGPSQAHLGEAWSFPRSVEALSG
jgi:hypothetical protein